MQKNQILSRERLGIAIKSHFRNKPEEALLSLDQCRIALKKAVALTEKLKPKLLSQNHPSNLQSEIKSLQFVLALLDRFLAQDCDILRWLKLWCFISLWINKLWHGQMWKQERGRKAGSKLHVEEEVSVS